MAIVPNLLGLDISTTDPDDALIAAGLHTVIPVDVTSVFTGYSNYQIVAQSPGAGASVPNGSSVSATYFKNTHAIPQTVIWGC